jgi:TrpR family transcriptional regulator, trp operon repressor
MDFNDDMTELIEIMAGITDADDMRRFFNEIFTVKETYDLALRWRLMKDLFRSIPQREISHNLGISLCKITRGSKILKKEDSLCRKLIAERTA